MKLTTILFLIGAFFSCSQNSSENGDQKGYEKDHILSSPEDKNVLELIIARTKNELDSSERDYFVSHHLLAGEIQDSISNLTLMGLRSFQLELPHIIGTDTLQLPSQSNYNIELYVSDLIENPLLKGKVVFTGILYYTDTHDKIIGGNSSTLLIKSQSDSLVIEEIYVVDY